MTKFDVIAKISPADPQSYQNKVFLTFDIDWCCDEVLADVVDIVERAEVPATWFITHATPVLDRLRSNPIFELGIHPNFVPLLGGDYKNGRNIEEVVERLLEIVPEATSMRSHSLFEYTGLWDLLKKKGISHECNNFIPYQCGMPLVPWDLWTGLIRVPHCWEDDVACLYGQPTDFAAILKSGKLNVFDFHPIHVFLNSVDLDLYERTRPIHRKVDELILIRDGRKNGTRYLLKDLLKLAFAGN